MIRLHVTWHMTCNVMSAYITSDPSLGRGVSTPKHAATASRTESTFYPRTFLSIGGEGRIFPYCFKVANMPENTAPVDSLPAAMDADPAPIPIPDIGTKPLRVVHNVNPLLGPEPDASDIPASLRYHAEKEVLLHKAYNPELHNVTYKAPEGQLVLHHDYMTAADAYVLTTVGHLEKQLDLAYDRAGVPESARIPASCWEIPLRTAVAYIKVNKDTILGGETMLTGMDVDRFCDELHSMCNVSYGRLCGGASLVNYPNTDDEEVGVDQPLVFGGFDIPGYGANAVNVQGERVVRAAHSEPAPARVAEAAPAQVRAARTVQVAPSLPHEPAVVRAVHAGEPRAIVDRAVPAVVSRTVQVPPPQPNPPGDVVHAGQERVAYAAPQVRNDVLPMEVTKQLLKTVKAPSASDWRSDDPDAYCLAMDRYVSVTGLDRMSNSVLMIVWSALPDHVRMAVAPADYARAYCDDAGDSMWDGLDAYEHWPALRAAILAHYRPVAQAHHQDALTKLSFRRGKGRQYQQLFLRHLSRLDTYHRPSDVTLLRTLQKAQYTLLARMPSVVMHNGSTRWLPADWHKLLIAMVDADTAIAESDSAGPKSGGPSDEDPKDPPAGGGPDSKKSDQRRTNGRGRKNKRNQDSAAGGPSKVPKTDTTASGSGGKAAASGSGSSKSEALARFEARMATATPQQKQWAKERKCTLCGSSEHFYRACKAKKKKE